MLLAIMEAKMQNVKVVCFDLLGTIVKSSNSYGDKYLDAFKQFGIEKEEILDRIRDYAMVNQLNLGQIVDDLFENFGIDSNHEKKHEVMKRWKLDVDNTEWLPDARRLLKAMRAAKKNLVLISNVTMPHWEITDRRLGVGDWFHMKFLSFREGIAKPNPEVFERVGNWLGGYKGSEILMISSNKEDLVVPAVLCWKTRKIDDAGKDLAKLIEELS